MADSKKTQDDGLTKTDFVRGFKEIGIKQGDVVLIHSAMRTIGCDVQGGPQTVVDALLEVVGKRGTLVVPTFTCYQWRTTVTANIMEGF